MPTCVDIVDIVLYVDIMCRDYRYHNVDTWEVMEDQSRSGHRASIIDLSFFRTSSTLGASVKYAVSRIDTIFYILYVFSSIKLTPYITDAPCRP